MNRTRPIDFSNYQRTHNNAIDLVAQAAGHARMAGKPVKAYVLKPASFDLFRAGLEVLMKKPLDPVMVLTWEGVEVRKGTRMQFDSLIVEYWPAPAAEN